jgi:hypothetical protein
MKKIVIRNALAESNSQLNQHFDSTWQKAVWALYEFRQIAIFGQSMQPFMFKKK